MARIVYISKYPPMEGGIASKGYWLAQALAKRGHHVHVVTDREGEDQIHTITSAISIPDHPDLTVDRSEKKIPWHIPHDEHRALSLLDKTLDVKANHHWQHKGWHRVIDIWQRLGEGFDFLVVSQGIGQEEFQTYTIERLGTRVNWRPFSSPWEMPSLLRSVDFLFHFETDLPFPVFSNLAAEALLCGTAVVSDQENLIDRYRQHGFDFSRQRKLVLLVEKEDPCKASEAIRDYITVQPAPPDTQTHSGYGQYISVHEEVLSRARLGGDSQQIQFRLTSKDKT